MSYFYTPEMEEKFEISQEVDPRDIGQISELAQKFQSARIELYNLDRITRYPWIFDTPQQFQQALTELQWLRYEQGKMIRQLQQLEDKYGKETVEEIYEENAPEIQQSLLVKHPRGIRRTSHR